MRKVYSINRKEEKNFEGTRDAPKRLPAQQARR